ncbi:hypothetical protein PR202_ga22313 [Eleusine coracana subsp. coracana]|uniref:At1g61320/AtMIF1 LRR domain-containing protein n=1 Tax=Eleusine coracana subsp. coracana TaxID=191504 RepID=A0AAV5D2S5_ELECO|nr:hypothetical protein PR202_ga22313 [Eleusine coracana subsp. coracana]
MMPSKFLHLKYLNISLVESSISNYDYFSLIPFLSASRTLETFILRITCFVHTADRHHDSVLDGVCGDQLHLRQIPGCLRLDNLKNLRITRFRPSKSLVELTSHIVQNAAALLRVTLDAAAGCRGRRTAATNWCSPMNTEMVREAHKGAEIARKLH